MSVKPLQAYHTITERLRAAGCVFAEEEAELLIAQATTADELDHMVTRRVAGRPLEHILGWAEFDGLRIKVGPGVFVPRRRSEFLVQQAALMTRPGYTVVDIGCGSGALGMALAKRVGGLELHATDKEPTAIAYARLNLAGLGAVYEGDLFASLPTNLQGSVDILLVNAPYVPTEKIALMPIEARVHEPLVALDGGPDGLDVQRRVAAEAADWLKPGGHVFVETSERQAPETQRIFSAHGLAVHTKRNDEMDATVVIAE